MPERDAEALAIERSKTHQPPDHEEQSDPFDTIFWALFTNIIPNEARKRPPLAFLVIAAQFFGGLGWGCSQSTVEHSIEAEAGSADLEIPDSRPDP